MEDTFPRAGQEDGCAPVGTGWPSPVDGEQGGKWLSRVVRGGALPRSRLWAVPVPLPPSRSPLSWACGGHEAELSHKQGPPTLLSPSGAVLKRVVVLRPGTSVMEAKPRGKGPER